MSEEPYNIEFLQSFDLVVRLMLLARSQRIIAKKCTC